MQKQLLIITALLIISTIICGCAKENAQDLFNSSDCDTTDVKYSSVINPIVQMKCALSGCHINASTSGYDFTKFAGFQSVALSGKLLPAINHTGPVQMPKDAPKLDDCTISKITKWVNDGAPEN